MVIPKILNTSLLVLRLTSLKFPCRVCCLCLSVIFSVNSLALGQETNNPEQWTRFRGPNGSGIVGSAEIDPNFSPERICWQARLAGAGHSSPIVHGRLVFVTSFVEPDQFWVEAFSLDSTKNAEPIWKWSTPATPHPMHRLNQVASSTPATDGERLYCLVPQADALQLVALTVNGDVAWSRDLGRWSAQHGFGVSPIVVDGTVIVMNSQETQNNRPPPGESELIALDAKSGADVWRLPIAAQRACYATPIVHEREDGSRQLLMATTGDGIAAVDLSNGQRLWNVKPLEHRTVGSPIFSGGLILANNGSGGGGNYFVTIDLTSDSPREVYRQHQSIGYVPTLICLNGLVFSCTDRGLISCWDLASGESVWNERVSSGFTSSPVSDGKNLFCVDNSGKVFVVSAEREFTKPASFPLGEDCQATPAIADGKIIFRTATQLFCF